MKTQFDLHDLHERRNEYEPWRREGEREGEGVGEGGGGGDAKKIINHHLWMLDHWTPPHYCCFFGSVVDHMEHMNC